MSETKQLKNTALTQKHIDLGARMTPFAGYNMPVLYTNIIDEHKAVRENVGVFDVSHMGEFIVRGKGALDLLQLVTSNDVSKLEIGEIQYSCMPNHNGGIIDDLLVYRLSEENCSQGERAYMLVVNASNIEKDWEWIAQHNDFDTHLINISERTGLLAVQGPNAAKALQELTDIDLAGLKYYTFTKGEFAGLADVLVSATGYTGAGGFEIYVNNDQMPTLWDRLMHVGNKHGLVTVGLGARDTLRLEMGYCLYGNDIDDSTSPIEAGLSWITKLGKGDFNSSEIFKAQKENGIDKKLVAFKVEDRRVPRHDYEIQDAEGNKIGRVTSGTMSPSLGYPIGMGYVQKAFAKKETEIFISTGKKSLKATVVKLPFHSK